MTSRRLLKAAQAIREVVSMAILTELRDPRVKYVTVTKVEVLPDMKQAKVYVTIMGEETQQRLSLRGLQNAAGFLQAKIAERIDTRYTPRLEFLLDEGAKNLQQIDQILRRVLPTDSDTSDEDEELEDAEAEGDADASHFDDEESDEADATNERPDASS
ncbi:MAG: 30S ribosome-binding factor RbfA [Pirellula sp.]|nr:30S ribosome-binding factor RbfA [Pirellula sp.]